MRSRKNKKSKRLEISRKYLAHSTFDEFLESVIIYGNINKIFEKCINIKFSNGYTRWFKENDIIYQKKSCCGETMFNIKKNAIKEMRL